MTDVDILVKFESTNLKKDLVLDNGSDSIMAAICESGATGGEKQNYDVNKEHVVGHADCDNNNTGKRKKMRRKKARKRKFPQWEDQSAHDDSGKHSSCSRDRYLPCGQPVAPFNTTQFLIEDHNVQSPDYIKISKSLKRSRLNSDDENPEFSSGEYEEEFQQREFREAYDEIHAERLDSMNKSDLIQEYLQLENRVDQLENQLKGNRRTRTESSCTTDTEVQTWDPVLSDDEETVEKIRIFEEEIRKLQTENAVLREENARLRTDSESSEHRFSGETVGEPMQWDKRPATKMSDSTSSSLSREDQGSKESTELETTGNTMAVDPIGSSDDVEMQQCSEITSVDKT